MNDAAQALLARCEAAGVRLRIEGGQLYYRARKAALSPELAAAIRRHKPALLALLSEYPRPLMPVDSVASAAAVPARPSDPQAMHAAQVKEPLAAALARLCAGRSIPAAEVLSVLTLDDVADWHAGALPEAALQAMVQAWEDGTSMRQGAVPDGWTQPALCRHCGPVWLWPSAPAKVLGCPRCFLPDPIPRPGAAASSD